VEVAQGAVRKTANYHMVAQRQSDKINDASGTTSPSRVPLPTTMTVLNGTALVQMQQRLVGKTKQQGGGTEERETGGGECRGPGRVPVGPGCQWPKENTSMLNTRSVHKLRFAPLVPSKRSKQSLAN
jgi:hypothetical protein